VSWSQPFQSKRARDDGKADINICAAEVYVIQVQPKITP
jgi:hypothetical protein